MWVRGKEMSYHFLLAKKCNYLEDYSLKDGKYDFAVSGKLLVDFPEKELCGVLAKLDTYRDDKQEKELIEKISKKYSINKSNIVLGAGANGILQNLIRMYIRKHTDNLISTFYTFDQAIYAVNSIGGIVKLVKEDRNFLINLDKVSDSIDENTKMIFLTNPNNPTGTLISAENIIKLANKTDVPIIVSEAGQAFSGEKSLLEFSNLPDNLVVIKSFSKDYGLAGIRLGYAYMSEAIRKYYLENSPTNQVSLVAIKIANTLFGHAYMQNNISKVIENREYMQTKLKTLNISYINSKSNAVMIKDSLNPLVITKLREKGFIVKEVCGVANEHYIRLSVVDKKTINLFIESMREIKEKLNEDFFSN